MEQEIQNPVALVVDDDVRDQKLLSHLLAEEGIECQTASTADEAIALLADHRFALVIVDVVLGQTDASSLHDFIADQMPQLASRIIVTSGFDPLEVRKRLPRYDGPVLYKPFTLAEFQSLVRGVRLLEDLKPA